MTRLPRCGKPVPPRPRRSSDDDAFEVLVAGEPLPPGAPTAAAEVALLLAALTAAASEAETADEWRAIAAFRAAKEAPLPDPVPAGRSLRARVLAGVATAAVVLTGTAAVAATGNLPASLQRLAAAVGAPEPAQDRAPRSDGPEGPDRPDVATPAVSTSTAPQTSAAPPATSAAPPATPAAPATSAAPSTSLLPSPAVTAGPVGPDANGAPARGLCTAWRKGGLPSSSVAFGTLAAAAGGEAGVGAYCDGLAHPGGNATARPTQVTEHPGGKPTARPSQAVGNPRPTATTRPTKQAAPTGTTTAGPPDVVVTAPVPDEQTTAPTPSHGRPKVPGERRAQAGKTQGGARAEQPQKPAKATKADRP